MSPKPRVLIVDASPETRDVLRTLLQRRGAETLEATEARQATEILQQEHPDLVILDSECDNSPKRRDTQALGLSASRNDTPIVLLGTAKRHETPLPTGQFVAKPYHYAPLIRRIENLLGRLG